MWTAIDIDMRKNKQKMQIFLLIFVFPIYESGRGPLFETAALDAFAHNISIKKKWFNILKFLTYFLYHLSQYWVWKYLVWRKSIWTFLRTNLLRLEKQNCLLCWFYYLYNGTKSFFLWTIIIFYCRSIFSTWQMRKNFLPEKVNQFLKKLVRTHISKFFIFYGFELSKFNQLHLGVTKCINSENLNINSFQCRLFLGITRLVLWLKSTLLLKNKMHWYSYL